MRSLTSCLIVIIFLFAGCKKSDKSTDTSTNSIIGSWNWLKTTHGWAPQTTPATEHYNEVRVFQTNGSYYDYRNGVYFKRGSFILLASTADLYTITIDGITQPLTFEDASHIHFGFGSGDGDEYYYERQ